MCSEVGTKTKRDKAFFHSSKGPGTEQQAKEGKERRAGSSVLKVERKKEKGGEGENPATLERNRLSPVGKGGRGEKTAIPKGTSCRRGKKGHALSIILSGRNRGKKVQ